MNYSQIWVKSAYNHTQETNRLRVPRHMTGALEGNVYQPPVKRIGRHDGRRRDDKNGPNYYHQGNCLTRLDMQVRGQEKWGCQRVSGSGLEVIKHPRKGWRGVYGR